MLANFEVTASIPMTGDPIADAATISGLADSIESFTAAVSHGGGKVTAKMRRKNDAHPPQPVTSPVAAE